MEQIQEEIRQKVTEYVRIEQQYQKQQTEIKTLKDRTKSYEDEIGEMKKFIEKLKKDSINSKEEAYQTQQEIGKYKNAMTKLQHEVDARREQEKAMIDQLHQNDSTMQQLQNELRNERNKVQEFQRNIAHLKQNLNDLIVEKDNYEKSMKEIIFKVNIFLIFFSFLKKNTNFNYSSRKKTKNFKIKDKIWR